MGERVIKMGKGYVMGDKAHILPNASTYACFITERCVRKGMGIPESQKEIDLLA